MFLASVAAEAFFIDLRGKYGDTDQEIYKFN